MTSHHAEVACLGEALIDLVSQKNGVGLEQAPGFRKAPGGAPANVAVGVSRLGRHAAFLGAVGADPFGTFLVQTLARHGVDVSGVARTDRRTALALVSLKADGERDFLFYGHRPAHLGLRLTTGMRALLRGTRIIHYGSISLIGGPARQATLSGIREAHRARRLCSYDPNLRLNLWPDARTARRWMREGLRHADLVKVNEEELVFLTGKHSVAQGLRALVAAGPGLAVATLGSNGCAYYGGMGEGKVPGLPVRAIDTTGAGDAFVAGMLVGLLEASGTPRPDLPDAARLEAILTFANAAAALSTLHHGGIPSLPSRRRVLAFLREQGTNVTTVFGRHRTKLGHEEPSTA
jgi:fructokinase